MIKILLSAVGMHDPYGADDSEGPVLAAVNELEPDILFLFPTRIQLNEKLNSTEGKSRDTKAALGERWPKLKVYERALNLPDPTNYGNIIKLLDEEIEEIKNQYSGSATEYAIAISSGTPQMQAAFLVLLSGNRLKAKACQVIDPRYLEQGDSRVRLVETHFMEESNQLSRARKFFSQNSFNSAGAELLELACYTIYPEREKKSEVFHDLLSGYFYWDLYQHKKALEQLRKCQSHLERYGGFEELAAILRGQVETLEAIVELGENEGYLNLADLYHNALRRLHGHQYVDCLSRFKRIYEGTYYYTAEKALNIRSKKVDNLQLEDRRYLSKSYGYLNTHDISKLYKLKKDNADIVSPNFEQQLNELATQRNQTINNHGMKSVTKKDAEKAMDLAGKLLKKVFPGEDLEGYCFSKQALDRIEELIFDRL